VHLQRNLRNRGRMIIGEPKYFVPRREDVGAGHASDGSSAKPRPPLDGIRKRRWRSRGRNFFPRIAAPAPLALWRLQRALSLQFDQFAFGAQFRAMSPLALRRHHRTALVDRSPAHPTSSCRCKHRLFRDNPIYHKIMPIGQLNTRFFLSLRHLASRTGARPMPPRNEIAEKCVRHSTSVTISRSRIRRLLSIAPNDISLESERLMLMRARVGPQHV
jgi:hypothetical protein